MIRKRFFILHSVCDDDASTGSNSPSARKEENGTGVGITLDAIKMHLKSVTVSVRIVKRCT